MKWHLILLSFQMINVSISLPIVCDFETPCYDFDSDYSWGLTDGHHPLPIDHDHTLNSKDGHYLFYIPQQTSRFTVAEIKTNNWLIINTDRAVCFQLWYYTHVPYVPFTIQLVQGDDEALTRIVASLPSNSTVIEDWTNVRFQLPAEKFKIFIRVNVSYGPLNFDDLSIDYCDEPRPSPTKTIFSCDFESSCENDFVSLSDYFYQWITLPAEYAILQEPTAPSVDFTFHNSSGHYMCPSNVTFSQIGNVTYFRTRSIFNFDYSTTYCLNFEYYSYRSIYSNLNVYALMNTTFPMVQRLWPLSSSFPPARFDNKWAWGIINLPLGSYSLLFRIDNTNFRAGGFALDNMIIESCNYPSTNLNPYFSWLSFNCDFDDGTMCTLVNDDQISRSTINFQYANGMIIPNPNLGPNTDHTKNSSSGGFVYWNRTLPFVPGDSGRMKTLKSFEQTSGTCIRFAYYVKSTSMNNNGTMLSLSIGGCYATTLWSISLDDSHGWQSATASVLAFTCSVTFYFDVIQKIPVEVSVAFDDIQVAQCKTLNNS